MDSPACFKLFFSCALILSQRRLTSLAVSTCASPNTCGCLRTIFSQSPCTTSSMLKSPCSLHTCEWKTTWNKTSPSSSHMCSLSPSCAASINSQLSSTKYGNSECVVCWRSHGQPCSERRRAIISTRSLNVYFMPQKIESITADRPRRVNLIVQQRTCNFSKKIYLGIAFIK